MEKDPGFSKRREWRHTSQRLKKRRLRDFKLCFEDLVCYNKGLDTGVFPLCSQDSSHEVKDISPPGLLRMTEAVLNLVSSESLEDVQEMGSVYYKNFSVSGILSLNIYWCPEGASSRYLASD